MHQEESNFFQQTGYFWTQWVQAIHSLFGTMMYANTRNVEKICSYQRNFDEMAFKLRYFTNKKTLDPGLN